MRVNLTSCADTVPYCNKLRIFLTVRYIDFFFSFPGEFVDKVVSKSPTRHFIIHARKALLSGLSPAENRKVPPLKYVTPMIFFV